MKWTLTVMTVLVVVASVGAASADQPSCDAGTSPLYSQAGADARCPGVCTGAGYEKWNGQWTNTPPSGAGPVCGCVVKSRDAGTEPLYSQGDADSLCPGVCKGANGLWNGQWTNAPPSGAGPVCGCYDMKAGDVEARPIDDQGDADALCPGVCASEAQGVWNGQWTNTPPSGIGPVCGCLTPACS